MAQHDVTIKAIDRVCEDVLVGSLSRPPGYRFVPGQWFRLGVATGSQVEFRTLSHASAPADEDLQFATRLSDSAFKQALARSSVGDTVVITGPGGRPPLPEGWTRAVMLIGGVGITPVRSIVRDLVLSGRHIEDALLVYGNRAPDCVLFADELSGLDDHSVRVLNVFEETPPGMAAETGFITEALLARHGVSADGRPFLVAGPPAMVAAMERVLDGLGVAESDRHVERFGPPA